MRKIAGKIGFVLANIVVMVIFHGNSKQFWPKIPWFSLRDESVAEHSRLLFNTFAVVTLGQALLRRLPRNRWKPRGIVLGVLPASLPALIWFGHKVLRLSGTRAEVYNLSLVPLLPIAAVVLEDQLDAHFNSEAEPINA